MSGKRKTPTYHLVADLYPQVGSTHFSAYAGAALSCWIRSDAAAKSPADAARSAVSAEGWQLVEILEQEEVTLDTYRDRPEERTLMQQGLRDGISSTIHRRRREVLYRNGGGDTCSLAPAELLAFAKRVKVGGAFSLYSDTHGQWANGVSPDGDEFLPLWLDRESGAEWIAQWPSYEVRDLEPSHLTETFLTGINEAKMWAAISLEADRLVTVHSIAIRDLLLGKTSLSPPSTPAA